MSVVLGRSHTSRLRSTARDQEIAALRNGDRQAPQQHFDLANPADKRAASNSSADLIRASPEYGNLPALKARLAKPVLPCRMAQHVAKYFLEDHIAARCVLCAPATLPDGIERICGFHPDCPSLYIFANCTVGCALDCGPNGLPPPVIRENYNSLDEFPASVEAGFLKHYRAGAYGPPKRSPGNPSVPRALRNVSVVSTAYPTRLAPLGAAIRYSDRRLAEALGITPKVRITYDLTATGVNEATYGSKRWSYRYAALEGLRPFLTTDCFMASFDLKSFYCQCPVNEDASQCFYCKVPPLSPAGRAELGITGDGPHFVRYRTLPMGWTASCAHASTIAAAICEEAMRRGAYGVVSYIDDFIVTAPTYAECARSQQILRTVIEERFGLVINDSKTQRPAQQLTWIGIEVDSEKAMFTISQERQDRIADEIDSILAADSVTAAQLRSCYGRLTWLAHTMRGAKAFSSPLFRTLRHRRGSARILLTRSDKADLGWFLRQLRGSAWVGSRWLEPSNQLAYTKSDAGDDAVFLVCEGRFVFHRLTASERKLSSHARELLPAVIASRVFGAEWHNKVVAMMFDNSGTAFSVSRGSSRTDDGARDMLRAQARLSLHHNFDLIGVWAPRSTNVLCDAGSKLKDLITSTRPIRLDYSTAERAAASLPVGAGCWLFPKAHVKGTEDIVGYVLGDTPRC